MFSLIFLFFAWSKSTSTPGSIEDSDFWLVIQNSTTQILGLVIAVYTVRRKSPEDSAAWRYAFVFTVVGIMCAVAPIPMYLHLPTMWGSVVSFFATAMQSCAALEIATMTDHPKLKQA